MPTESGIGSSANNVCPLWKTPITKDDVEKCMNKDISDEEIDLDSVR